MSIAPLYEFDEEWRQRIIKLHMDERLMELRQFYSEL
jgi:predicted HTH domain antitoxin